MRIASRLIHGLAEAGFSRQAAALASMARRGQSFSIDEQGHWVNRSEKAILVSPSVHTIPFDALDTQVLDYWTWDYLPQPGDTVIDVGAGMGDGLVTFSRLVGPKGRVIAIEAHPETYSCMLKTIDRSGLTNITPVHCALVDKDGEISISDGENHLSNSIFSSGSIRVLTRSLDSLSEELGLASIAFLKMNIEGAERLAIAGMNNVRPAHVCISCHDFVADRSGEDSFRTKETVRAALSNLGYTITSRSDDVRPWVRDYLYGAQ